MPKVASWRATLGKQRQNRFNRSRHFRPGGLFPFQEEPSALFAATEPQQSESPNGCQSHGSRLWNGIQGKQVAPCITVK